jgi:hypothetical protein
MFTNGILPQMTGGVSFSRLLGCEQNPTQECDCPAHRGHHAKPRRLGLMLEATCREELGALPATIPSEGYRTIRHTWLAMLLHPSLVHDSKSSCDDTSQSQDACDKYLGFHSTGERSLTDCA